MQDNDESSSMMSETDRQDTDQRSEQDILDDLFQNVEQVINDELGDEFTFQEFRQKITRDRQNSYIDLLDRRRHKRSPFGSAHFFIYQRLQSRLDDFGLTMEQVSDDGDTDIFGNPAKLHMIRPDDSDDA